MIHGACVSLPLPFLYYLVVVIITKMHYFVAVIINSHKFSYTLRLRSFFFTPYENTLSIVKLLPVNVLCSFLLCNRVKVSMVPNIYCVLAHFNELLTFPPKPAYSDCMNPHSLFVESKFISSTICANYTHTF